MVHHIILTGLAVLVLLLVAKRFFRKSEIPLPPGPKPWPIIGNTLHMPAVQPWKTYREWCETSRECYLRIRTNELDRPLISLYVVGSDIVFLHLPGFPTLVIGSLQAATDLLDKRSQTYSSRPSMAMVDMYVLVCTPLVTCDGSLVYFLLLRMTWNEFHVGSMQHDANWRNHRRVFHQHFRQAAMEKLRPDQQRWARAFASWILHSPHGTGGFIRQWVSFDIIIATSHTHY